MAKLVDPRGVVATPRSLAARVAARVPRGASLLDPSCGLGALLAAARDLGTRADRLHGLELDPQTAEAARRALPGASIVTADALESAWPGGTWVLANPPWCSFSGRQASGVGRREARLGWPSLHGAFLERIAQHVAQEGTGAVVLLPASVIELKRYGPLRERVTGLARPTYAPVELGEDAFPGVLEPAVLLELRPRRPGEGASPQPWSSREAHPLVEALAPFPRLPARTFADPGVHSGNCAGELVQGTERSDLPGLRQGRDLSAWHLGPPSARLEIGLERADDRRFRVPALEVMVSFPLLLRQTADRPIAALHTRPTYFRNSLLAARAVEDLDARFVAAVLNSNTLANWHRAAHRDARQRAFPQVKVGHLNAMPFPIVRRSEDPPLHDALVAAYGDGSRVDQLVAEAFGLGPSQTGS